ncbi:MAG: hypothetical protein Q9170_002791 [Blastenia crenularia]
MFAGRTSADISMESLANTESDVLDALFNEELGAVFQIRKGNEIEFNKCFATCGPPDGLIKIIGYVPPSSKQSLTVRFHDQKLIELDRATMQRWWSSTSYQMQRFRDDPGCAQAEFDALLDSSDPGLSWDAKLDPPGIKLPPLMSFKSMLQPPRVAVLREQGINGHSEMAFAFRAAGFEAVDVHMTDILDGLSLEKFCGLAACGGFSYGDVLGAGNGWAQSILRNDVARRTFQAFFNRPNTFTLGVCNGCQMLTRIKELIPGADHWPNFVQNTSQQFEARFSMVQIQDTKPSVFFDGMNGSRMPIVVSHGEGRAEFAGPSDMQALNEKGLVPLRYVDNYGNVTQQYPFNPNGSPEGIAAVKSCDGRVLAVMPHPERTIMADVASWVPKEKLDQWGKQGPYGPWYRIFLNARRWVG